MRRAARIVAIHAAALAGLGAAWYALAAVSDLPEPRQPRAVAEVSLEAEAALEEVDAHVLAQLATAEDPDAAEAVAWVVLNRAGCRVRPLRCDRPVLEVVTARRAFGTTRGGVYRSAWFPRRAASVRVAGKVRAVLLGLAGDPTGGATHFHRVGTWTPPWAPPARSWRVLGRHAFYREARPESRRLRTFFS